MHVITQTRIWEAVVRFPESAKELEVWYRAMKGGQFTTFAELRKTFRSVDKVGKLYVFNVGGGRVRVICAVHLNRGKAYIRAVLDHAEYDRDAWKK